MSKRILNRYAEFLAIKERKEGRRITQRVAAEETGLTTVTIGRYARNEVTRYDTPVLLTLCEYLGCTISEFLIEANENGESNPEIEAIPA